MDRRPKGFPRRMGSAGIRNRLLVLYCVNCCRHEAERICDGLNKNEHVADLAGNESCFDNQVVIDRMLALIAHPNTAAVLVVGHGCEFIRADALRRYADRIGRPSAVVMTQTLGTRAAIAEGLRLGRILLETLAWQKRSASVEPLTIGLLGDVRALPDLEAAWLVDGARVVLPSKAPPGAAFDGAEDQLEAFMERLRHFAAINPMPRKAPLPDLPVQGVLPIGTFPKAPGLWVVDTLQHREMERGFAATSLPEQAMDLVCAGAHLILMQSQGWAPCGTVLAPVFSIVPPGAAMEADAREGDDIDGAMAPVIEGSPTASEALGLYESILHASLQSIPGDPPCKMPQW